MAGMSDGRISATASPEPATLSHQIPSDPSSIRCGIIRCRSAGAAFVSFIGQVLPQAVEAYRDGGGVSYGDYDSRLAHGIAAMNGPAYQADLGST